MNASSQLREGKNFSQGEMQEIRALSQFSTSKYFSN